MKKSNFSHNSNSFRKSITVPIIRSRPEDAPAIWCFTFGETTFFLEIIDYVGVKLKVDSIMFNSGEIFYFSNDDLLSIKWIFRLFFGRKKVWKIVRKRIFEILIDQKIKIWDFSKIFTHNLSKRSYLSWGNILKKSLFLDMSIFIKFMVGLWKI